MILAIDPGMAKVGWAVIDPVEVRLVELGVITTEQDKGVDKNVDRARRISVVARELRELLVRHGCTAIAAEDLLGHGSVHAVIPQALCWGAILELAGAAGLELQGVLAKDWQHAVVPGLKRVKKKQRYAKVAARLKRFIGELRLLVIPAELQTHAIDAVGVGVYAAVRPSSKRRIARAA